MKQLLLLTFLFSNVSFGQFWYQIDDFPSTQRDDGIHFKIGTDVYCGTGQTPWWSSLSDFYKFNTLTDEWTTIESMPVGEERFYSTGYSYNGKGYVFGGFNSTDFLNDFWEYDPILDQWNELDSLPGIGRSGSASFLIDSFAYVIGGTSGNIGRLDEVWRYNLESHQWEEMNNLPFGARWRGSAIAKDGIGYFMFGRDTSDVFYNDLYSYSIETDDWNYINTFPEQGRSHASMTICNNEIYLLTGIDSLDNCYNDFWHLNTNPYLWTELISIPTTGLRGAICFSSHNSVYYSTGIDQDNVRVRTTWKIGYPLDLAQKEKNDPIFYPNPSSGIIKTNNFEIENPEILNSNGKIVFQMEGEFDELNLTHLENGIYFLNFKNTSNVQRIVILK